MATLLSLVSNENAPTAATVEAPELKNHPVQRKFKMNNSTAIAHSLTFQEITFDVIERDGETWIRGSQIGLALGYKNPSADMSNLYDRNSDEFTNTMTALVKLPDPYLQTASAGQIREVRVFSLRGAHLLAMLSRTKIAKAFRKWVLDILESAIISVATPAYRKEQTRKALPLGLTIEQQDVVKAHHKVLVQSAPKEKQAKLAITLWSAVKSKFGVSYKAVPPDDFVNVISLMSRLALEGEHLPPEGPSKITPATIKELDSYLLEYGFGVGMSIETVKGTLKNLECLLQNLQAIKSVNQEVRKQIAST